jgi:hypothetical protein
MAVASYGLRLLHLCGLPGFNLFSTLTEPELPTIVRLMMIELFGGPS